MSEGPTILIDINGEWVYPDGYHNGLDVTRFDGEVYFNVVSYGHDYGRSLPIEQWRKLIKAEAIALGLLDEKETP